MCGAIVTSPFDVIKTCLQSSHFKINLDPILIGVIPARSIDSWTYGNGKHVFASQLNNGEENAWVH